MWELDIIKRDFCSLEEAVKILIEENALLKTPLGKFKQANSTQSKLIESINKDQYIKPEGDLSQKTKLYEDDKIIIEENSHIQEANRQLLNRIIELIKNTGVSETYSERSWSTKPKTKTINWVTSLRNIVQQLGSGNFTKESLDSLYNSYVTKYNAVQKAKEKEESDKKQKELQKQNETKKTIAIVEASNYFSLDPLTQTVELLLEKLLDSDKYLNLANAMIETRNDWSEGFYRVSTKLDSFLIETEDDKEIIKEITDICYGEDLDGRYFRDCKFNYDWIFSNKVPEDKLCLYNKLSEFKQEYY